MVNRSCGETRGSSRSTAAKGFDLLQLPGPIGEIEPRCLLANFLAFAPGLAEEEQAGVGVAVGDDVDV